MIGPPRLAERILEWCLPQSLRDDVLDDLTELFESRVQSLGLLAARRWYWQQLPGTLLRLGVASLPGGTLHRSSQSEPVTTGVMMSNLLTDLRYAVRSLRRSPGFTAIAVLTLGLGIGANAAIFSVVRTVLLRPLSFPEPGRLVRLWEMRKDRGWAQSSFTYGNFWDVHDRNRSFEEVGAIGWSTANLTGTERPERLSVGNVSTGYFRALGSPPAIGRIFETGEDLPGHDNHVLLVSHEYWQGHLAGDSSVVGRIVNLDNQSYRIVGVVPSGLPWLNVADVYIPMVRPADPNRSSFELVVIGRLNKGTTVAMAGPDLDRISRELAGQYPDLKDMGIRLGESRDWLVNESLRRSLWILMGAVGFLMLIACSNLANMLLARATAQLRERAVRAALGASRGRAIQQSLIEAGVLGLLGASAGLALAFGLMRLVRAYDPGNIPRLGEAKIDGPVLLVAIGTALLTAGLTGLITALRVPLSDVIAAIRSGERSIAGNRRAGLSRAVLVSIEVALSLVLLIGAGLLLRSFAAVVGGNRGFATEHRLLVEVGLPAARDSVDRIRVSQLAAQFHQRIEAMPQVISAGAVSGRPLRGSGTGMGFGKPGDGATDIPWASWRVVSKHYLQTMGVSIVAGRDFTEQDLGSRGDRVIVSQRIARQLWPDENPLGRQIVLWKGQNEVQAEIIGVAGDMRDWDLAGDPTYAVYIPFYGLPWTPLTYVIHSPMPSDALVPMLRQTLAELDPTLPLGNIRTMDELVDNSVGARRFTMLLLVWLAVVALMLALAGVYGVLSYTVSRRRSEIGIRIALGATASGVIGLVVRQGMRPVVIGVGCGVLGATLLTRFMRTMLFGVTPFDLPTYLGVVALLVLAGAVSCYLPARVARRVDVLNAVRGE